MSQLLETPVSKYEPLGQFLGRLDAEHWRPTFLELERHLGFDLPASARRRTAWWANSAGGAKSPARAWLDRGWTVEKVDLAKGVVSFAKSPDGAAAPAPPQPEAGARARLAEAAEAAKLRAQGAKDWAAERTDKAADLVRARPGLSVGAGAAFAFAAGVAVGLLLMPRRSRRDQVVELVDDRTGDLLHLIKDRIGRLHVPERAAALTHGRADDALHVLKEGLKALHLPAGAAEAARGRAEDALHALREGLKDLRAAVGERLGR
ncbi:MAG TPA: hypothetical protein VL460_04575 [Caulobacteraceae bacterium]|nr:hypothetical protein [Caulobacteraceae bacterium]